MRWQIQNIMKTTRPLMLSARSLDANMYCVVMIRGQVAFSQLFPCNRRRSGFVSQGGSRILQQHQSLIRAWFAYS